MKGKVYLIGAGPGDYKLITMRGLEYLQQAEVVVYDRLADNRLLAYAPKDAEMIYVGKASANHTMKQEDINQLLVDKALEGKTVVRLKGGDPFVFGRGGEEALLLVENDVPFEIVPGISSSIAVPAYAGIPVTHRGIAASFAVVTGHEDPTKTNSSIYWQNLAKATDTLVFLMGVENLPYITKQLIENGRSADTPAAVIRWGTKPEQRTLVTTLGSAAEDVKNTASDRPPSSSSVMSSRSAKSWLGSTPDRSLGRPCSLPVRVSRQVRSPLSSNRSVRRASKHRLSRSKHRPTITQVSTHLSKTFLRMNGSSSQASTA